MSDTGHKKFKRDLTISGAFPNTIHAGYYMYVLRPPPAAGGTLPLRSGCDLHPFTRHLVQDCTVACVRLFLTEVTGSPACETSVSRLAAVLHSL